ncbi:MAG: putative sulfoacetate transporter SauU [Paracidovorax wautersii]|uniref:Putative sulfoacetate transporter SauU n=1 Tax=Paracidovorax wautersii TaxID=1177982 RepID=A0A7V8FMB3_9BURK|nr:MAG: putative sulfoacetate transporter SauU [Paracidovorax wautersii]
MKNRWSALAVIFIAFLQFPLNWFSVVPAFGGIVGEMKLSFTQVGLIVGAFIAGYGVMHIPAGWFAERYGMRAGMIFGVVVETIGTAITGWAPTYEVLLAGRLLCGIGGAVTMGSAVGLTAAWFRGKELATANGIIQGVGFTIGAAIGLYGWSIVVEAMGWRPAMFVAAGVGAASLVFLLALFPTPPASGGDVLQGHHLDKHSLRRIFGNRTLWIMGIALLGAYGSYFSAANLLGAYAQERLKVAPAAGEAIGAILFFGGIFGGVIGGWLTDRVFGRLPTFLIACVAEGAMFFLIPYLNLVGLQIAAAVVGVGLIVAFVPWVSIPGEADSGLALSDVPTAIGLMLSIVAIGGATIPPLFAKIASSWGFDAAWQFQGLVTIGFALVALLARTQHAPRSGLARNAELN